MASTDYLEFNTLAAVHFAAQALRIAREHYREGKIDHERLCCIELAHAHLVHSLDDAHDSRRVLRVSVTSGASGPMRVSGGV